jgi:hypothetical protein
MTATRSLSETFVVFFCQAEENIAIAFVFKSDRVIVPYSVTTKAFEKHHQMDQ